MIGPAHNVVAALAAAGYDTRPDEHGRGWRAECANCNHLSDGLWPLRITEEVPGGPARLACINRCSETAILEAISFGGQVPAALASGEGWRTACPGLDVWNLAKLLSGPRVRVPWLAEPFLARGTVTLLAGREGLGKSMLGQALTAAITVAGETVGMQCVLGRVMVLDAENSQPIVIDRLRGFEHDLSALAYVGVQQGVFNLAERISDVEELVATFRADVLVLDSLRTLAPGLDENDSVQVAGFMGSLADLARRRDLAVLLLHHSAKADGEGYRGSTAFGALAEIVFNLSASADQLVLRCLKCRLAAKPGPLRFRIAQRENDRVALERIEQPARTGRSTGNAAASRRTDLTRRYVEALREHGKPMRWKDLRAAVGLTSDSESAKHARDEAIAAGLLVRVERGIYGLPEPAAGMEADRSVRPGPLKGRKDGRTDPTVPTEAAA